MGKKGEERDAATTPNSSASNFWKFPDDMDNFGNLANQLPETILQDFDVEPMEVWYQKLSDTISKDPTAIALICHRMMDAFHEYILGIPKQIRKTNTNFSGRPNGLYGKGKAWFDVSEINGRLVIHIYGVGWVGLPQWLLQKIVLSEELKQNIVEILNSVYHAFASPRLHATHLLRRINKMNFVKPSFFAPVNPRGLSGANYKECAMASMVCQNIHSHFPTCRKKKI